MEMLKKMSKVGLVLGMVCLLGLTQAKAEAQEFCAYKEGKGIILKVDGLKFNIGAGKGNWSHDWLWIDPAGVPGSVSSLCTNFLCPEHKGWSSTFAVRNIQEIKVILDKKDEKVVYIKARAYNHAEKKIVEPYYMEMNLRIKNGFPCLFVHQRVVNLGDIPKNLSFGSYVRRFSVYSNMDLKIRNVPKPNGGSLAGRANWIWVKRGRAEKTEGNKGLGMISFSGTCFSTWSNGHIYFSYAKGTVDEGNCLESKWAVMAAETPEEVKSLYEKIKDVELEPFLRPREQII